MREFVRLTNGQIVYPTMLIEEDTQIFSGINLVSPSLQEKKDYNVANIMKGEKGQVSMPEVFERLKRGHFTNGKMLNHLFGVAHEIIDERRKIKPAQDPVPDTEQKEKAPKPKRFEARHRRHHVGVF